jgi:hypothetical protein
MNTLYQRLFRAVFPQPEPAIRAQWTEAEDAAQHAVCQGKIRAAEARATFAEARATAAEARVAVLTAELAFVLNGAGPHQKEPS